MQPRHLSSRRLVADAMFFKKENMIYLYETQKHVQEQNKQFDQAEGQN
jgi:hypothetical protein